MAVFAMFQGAGMPGVPDMPDVPGWPDVPGNSLIPGPNARTRCQVPVFPEPG